MCWGEENPETDEQEAARIAAEQARVDAANAAKRAQQIAADKRSKELSDAKSNAERRALAATEGNMDVDIEDPEELLKKKAKARGVASLRINKASSLGGAPVGSGLTVG
jgi:hypothetical protein